MMIDRTIVRMDLPYKGKGRLYLADPGWHRDTRRRRGVTGKFNGADASWMIDRNDFTRLRDRILSDGYAVDERRESMCGTMKCDTRCTSAKHNKCVCSCGGANHRGGLGPQGFLVGDTTVIVPGELYWVKRLFNVREDDRLRDSAPQVWRDSQ